MQCNYLQGLQRPSCNTPVLRMQLQGGGALVCSNGSKTMQSDKLGAVQRAGCDTPAVRALLGSGGPTDASLMQFLGVLEQRTHELMQVIPGCSHPHAWCVNALVLPPDAPHILA